MQDFLSQALYLCLGFCALFLIKTEFIVFIFAYAISFAKKWLNYIILDVKEISPFVYRI